jgi:hypothetical protein
MAQTRDDLTETKRLMAALGRMPPKQHKDMKLGKPRTNPLRSPAKKGVRGASAKPKSA